MHTGIGNDVLHRFSRVVLVVRPILVMMVPFFGPMQHGMRQTLRLGERPTRCRHGHGLPQHGEQDKDGGGSAMHGRQCNGTA